MAQPSSKNQDGNLNEKPASRMNRRGFLKLLVPAGVMIGLGGSVYVLSRDKVFLRPPGAISEDHFLSLCIKCRKCEEICPHTVIEAVMITEDIAGSGSPKLNFREGACDFCMECVEVCPTGALEMLEVEEIKLGLAEVVPESCIAWDWGGCTLCEEACSYDAISLDERERPVVDAEKCNGCGFCEYECPGAALRSFRSTSGRGIIIVPFDQG